MHSFRENYLFSLFTAQSFLRKLTCDQQQAEEGLSVITKVYISSPRTAAPFFPQGARKVAVQPAST